MSLDGQWAFLEDPDGIGDEQGWQREDWDRSSWRSIQVPGVWTAAFEELLGYEGIGWYALTFDFEGEWMETFIRFGAVFLCASVYLNGELLGTHRGGYTPFHLPSGENLRPGQNFLVVRVDNRITNDTIPVFTEHHEEGHGWWPHGGLSRPVTLHRLPDPWIFKIEPGWSPESDRLGITLGLWSGSGPEEVMLDLEIGIPGGKVIEERVVLEAPGDGASFFQVLLDDIPPEPWSRDHPERIYSLDLSTGDDGARVYFGHRTVSLEGNLILLNGQPDYWWGVSRHSDYPDLGSVETQATIEREVTLLQDLHANHVRPGHYPVAPPLLDALAGAGITVMEEVPVYQLRGEQLEDPDLIEEALVQIGEMIERDRNNPAILTWSVGNEYSTWEPAAEDFTATLAAEVRRLDPTRPVAVVLMSVSCLTGTDYAVSEVDLVGQNEYFGWYVGTTDMAGQCADGLAEMIPDKPIVITEFGAGALAGRHLDTEPDEEPLNDHSYTEEWQAWFLAQHLEQFLSRDYISGVMPWALADFRMQWAPTTGNPHPVDGMNLKGLIDHQRVEKKLSFQAVSQIYAANQED
jgi:beta-glucuronidase